jgi:hypothetical protein
MKRIVISGIGVALVLGLGSLAGAQNQTTSNTQAAAGPSLGEYARQVRKDPGSTSKAKVFDNDNLPRQDKLSVVGKPEQPENSAPSNQDSSSSNNAAAAPAATSATSSAPATQVEKDAAAKQWSDKLTSQQSQIDLLTRELDVANKEYQLKAAAMYADAGNRLRNSTDWDKQDAQYKQQIADKQKALDDAKAKLEDMQEDARKAGVPSSVRDQAQEAQPQQQQ